MPTGNVPFLTASKYGKDSKSAGVVATLIRESPLLETLPWISFAGNALKKEVEGTLPSVEFRQVNAGYTPSHGSNDWTYWGVAILGGEYRVDKFLTNVVDNEKDVEAEQIVKMAKANAMRFDWEFINGDGTANGFRGIDALIDDGFGQTYANGGSAGPLSLTGLDEVNALFRNQGSASAILGSRRNQIRLTALARNTAGAFSLLDVTRDNFDRQIFQWGGTPYRIIGDTINSSGNVVAGIGDDVLYFAKFGRDDVCGLMGVGGELTVQSFGELESAPQKMGRMEWYPGVAAFSKFSLVRYTNING